MKEKVMLHGMVLSTTLVGDYDKRLVILTRERGKITAFSKGARRPGNAMMGVCQPFTFGSFTLFEGYDAYRLVSAEVKDYFSEVKEDIESVCYATYFCEFAEGLTVEGIGDIHMINLLYVSLKALSKKEITNELVRVVFEMKMLALEGMAMPVFSCARCKDKEPMVYCLQTGECICAACEKKLSEQENVISLSESTVYTLQYIISNGVERLYVFQVSKPVMRELLRVCQDYVKRHVDKKFNSLEILHSLS